MIKDKDSEFLNGMMEEGMKGTGKMENRMVRELTYHQMGEFEKEYGKMGRGLDGLDKADRNNEAFNIE